MICSQGKGQIVNWRDGAWDVVGYFYESPWGRKQIGFSDRGIQSERELCDRIAGAPAMDVFLVTEACWASIPFSESVDI